MSDVHFRQKSLVLARQIYPLIDGDDLITEAERIFTYLQSNNYQNFIGLNMLSDDILSFSEMLFVQSPSNNNRPLNLYEYQRDLLMAWQTGEDSLVVHARQMGITLLLCVYALWLASFRNKINLGFMVTRRAVMQEMIHRIVQLHTTSAFTLPGIDHFTSSSIEFENGNKIQMLTPSTYVVGGALSHILVENAAYSSFADDENVYSSIMFATRGQAIVTSTPCKTAGLFYELAESNILFNQSQKRVITFDAKGPDTSGWETYMRSVIGDESFENEYLCKFIDIKD